MAEITVGGFRAPRTAPSRPHRRHVPWVRPRHTLWALVVAGALIASGTAGTPHLRLSYTYAGPREAPRYWSCAYGGLHSQRIFPADEHCPLIMLLKARREG